MGKHEEVAKLLFGGGAEELVQKFKDQSPQAKDRRKRGLTAGLSAVGAAAGVGGLAYGAHDMGRAIKAGKKIPLKTKALVPLEIAGLSGELMATHILHGDTKKKKIAKMEPGGSDLHLSAGSLKKVAAKKAYAKSKPYAQKGFTTVKDKSKAVVCKWEGEISKVDEDKRQVFGWASIVEYNGEPVVDLQGDYMDIEEIEKSAYDYVIKSRHGGDMHSRDGDQPKVVGTMIESFIVTPEKKAKMGLPDSTPTGWWVGYQVEDPEVWDMVKSGKRTGFSIHGRGNRTPMEI